MGKLLKSYGEIYYTIESENHPYTEMTAVGRSKNLGERTTKANKIYNNLLLQHGKDNFICLFISIHANAFSNPSASGYEIFVYKIGNEATKLAKHIHQASKDILGVGTSIKDRGIKEANFAVLANTRMSAILIEHEFYTNIDAVKKLKDNEFRNKCAGHIKIGLLNYLRALE